ncbi:MAG: L,D-transpeptidase family protein [Deltaproteobacteria bacterium]|nr:L,D-transpeptidase family protein [Deltaproteobacteria bacterium]
MTALRQPHWSAILSIALTLFFLLAFDAAAVDSNPPETLVPDALIDPGTSKGHILVVIKAQQQLYVYRHDEQGNIWLEKILPCSTGMVQGDKLIRGDKKTPEGYYIFRQKLLPSELPEIYGILAYPMDYPNFWDRTVGRGGDGIWTHGVNKPLVDYDSNGCIELLNHDLAALEFDIKLFETPIVVYNDSHFSETAELKQKAKAVRTFIESWRRAWANKDLAAYASKYSRQFTNSDGLSYKVWMDRKKSVAQNYKKIEVTIENLTIYRHRETIVVSFKQDYKGDHRFSSVGLKRLYLADLGQGAFEILAEEFNPLPGPQPNKWLTAAQRILALTTPPLAVSQVAQPVAVASAGILLPPQLVLASEVKGPDPAVDDAAEAMAQEADRAALEGRSSGQTQEQQVLAELESDSKTPVSDSGATDLQAAAQLPPGNQPDSPPDQGSSSELATRSSDQSLGYNPPAEEPGQNVLQSSLVASNNGLQPSLVTSNNKIQSSFFTSNTAAVSSDDSPAASSQNEAINQKSPDAFDSQDTGQDPPDDSLQLDVPNALVMLEQWVQAWSARDSATYFKFYAPDFYFPDRKLDLAGFIRYRGRNIANASRIKVTFSDVEITIKDRQAEVTFIQIYESDRTNDRGQKTLRLSIYNGEWKIISESFKIIP